MEFVMNDFWVDPSRLQVPTFDFDGEFGMPILNIDSGYDFGGFDLDDLDVKIDDECLKSIFGSTDVDFDENSLESSMSSEASNSVSGSPLPSIESSKTPYSDATQCRRPSSNGHIRRPMNPFMVFAKEERRKMSSVTPDLHNAEISKICGKKWKAMTSEEKRPYEMESARLKVLHEKEYPGYKYKPRKKSKSLTNTKRERLIKAAEKSRQPMPKKVKVRDHAQKRGTGADSSKKSSFLMVNGQKIPLKTAKSSDNKSTFNLQLKIDENYKIVQASNSSPILQILPPVSEFGNSLRNVEVKQENIALSPVYFSMPNSAPDLSFSPIIVGGETVKSEIGNRVFVLVNCSSASELLTGEENSATYYTS